MITCDNVSSKYNKNESLNQKSFQNLTDKRFNSNKFLNKIKKTSKEKYLANKDNLKKTSQYNLNIYNTNTKKPQISNFVKKYNINSMTTGLLRYDQIFQPKIKPSADQGIK